MNAVTKLNDQKNVRSLLTNMKDQLTAALPKHVPVESYLRSALTLTQKNPKLLEADQFSFLGALMEAAQSGLALGSETYLIPFWNGRTKTYEVQKINDYKGLIKLMVQSGAVKAVRADVVRVGDDFVENDGFGVTHVRKFEQGEAKTVGGVSYVLPKEKTPIWAVYAEALLSNGTRQHVVLDMEEIERARSASKSPDKVWATHFVEMCKKTAVRRLAKLVPQSPELLRAMELEGLYNEHRSQGLRANIDPSFVPEFEPMDAITIKDINANADAAKEVEKKTKLINAVTVCIKELESKGIRSEQIFERLKLKNLAALEEETSEGLEHLLNAVIELQQR